jgi:capsule polysaccharide export protein KpsE/RkpR
MNGQEPEEGRTLFDFAPYILLIFRKRRLLAGHALFICVAAVIYAFFIAKLEYNSSVSFLPPVSTDILLSANLSGANILRSESYDIMDDQILSVFESNGLKRQIIEKFDLYKKYNLTNNKNKYILAVKRLNKNLGIEAMEKGLMYNSKMLSFTITAYAFSPDTALLMTQFAFSLLDSAVQSISTERACRSYVFIESQLSNNNAKLDSLQKSLQLFQEKTKMIDVPEQMKASFKTYANIKAMVILNEFKLQRLKSMFSSELPEIKEIEKTINIYREKLTHMEKDTTADPFPSFRQYRTSYPEYSNLIRDIDVEEYLVVYLRKELEHARLEKQKNMSNLIIIDPPRIPEYKARPKRLPLTIKIVFIYFLLLFGTLVGKEIITVRLNNGGLSKDASSDSGAKKVKPAV